MNALDSDPAAYLAAVVLLHVELPETPLSASIQDQLLARHLHDRGISLHLVESAMLLASLRRLVRPADLPALPPIRSLAYFQPVIEELLVHPMPDNYLEYLRLKLNRIARNATPSAEVQKIRFQMITNAPVSPDHRFQSFMVQTEVRHHVLQPTVLIVQRLLALRPIHVIPRTSDSSCTASCPVRAPVRSPHFRPSTASPPT